MKKKKPLFKLTKGESLVGGGKLTVKDKEILKTYSKHGLRNAVRKKRDLYGRY